MARPKLGERWKIRPEKEGAEEVEGQIVQIDSGKGKASVRVIGVHGEKADVRKGEHRIFSLETFDSPV